MQVAAAAAAAVTLNDEPDPARSAGSGSDAQDRHGSSTRAPPQGGASPDKGRGVPVVCDVCCTLTSGVSENS